MKLPFSTVKETVLAIRKAHELPAKCAEFESYRDAFLVLAGWTREELVQHPDWFAPAFTVVYAVHGSSPFRKTAVVYASSPEEAKERFNRDFVVSGSNVQFLEAIHG